VATKSSSVAATNFMIAEVRIVVVIEFIIITSFIELKMANFRSNLVLGFGQQYQQGFLYEKFSSARRSENSVEVIMALVFSFRSTAVKPGDIG